VLMSTCAKYAPRETDTIAQPGSNWLALYTALLYDMTTTLEQQQGLALHCLWGDKSS